MPDAGRSSTLARTWRALSPEQRAAGIGSVLLIVSTFGPFSFVEAAILLVAAAVLLLLKRRAEGRQFHLPMGDGTVIAAAGLWSALLIVIRLFDRPLGQGLLALACAAILVAAGVRERAKRPPDDLPAERARTTAPAGRDWLADPSAGEEPRRPMSVYRTAGSSAGGTAEGGGADPTVPLPQEPPELRLPGEAERAGESEQPAAPEPAESSEAQPAEGEPTQLRLPAEEPPPDRAPGAD